LLVVSLVGLLTFTSYTTTDIALKQYHKETLAIEQQNDQYSTRTRGQLEEYEEIQSLIRNTSSQSSYSTAENRIPRYREDSEDPTKTDDGAYSVELQSILASERKLPFDKISLATFLITVVITLNILKSDNRHFRNPFGITCGSVGYWLMTIIIFTLVLLIAVFMRGYVISNFERKKKLSYPFLPFDIRWDNTVYTLRYPLLCSLSGVAAAVWGVGGGILKAPIMLSMGMHPLVVSATCATMIFYTSLTATTMFITFGMLIWDYAIYFCMLGMITTLVGQYTVNHLVKQYNRASIISFTMAAIIIVSTILLSIQSVYHIHQRIHSGIVEKSVSFCPSGH
jgi:hypothetical protein